MPFAISYGVDGCSEGLSWLGFGKADSLLISLRYAGRRLFVAVIARYLVVEMGGLLPPSPGLWRIQTEIGHYHSEPGSGSPATWGSLDSWVAPRSDQRGGAWVIGKSEMGAGFFVSLRMT